MKFTVSSNELAEAMGKIFSAVPAQKAKGEVREPCISFNISSKHKVENASVGVVIAFDGKKQLLSSIKIEDLEMEEEKASIYPNAKKIMDIANAISATSAPISMEIGKDCLIKGGGTEAHFALGQSAKTFPIERNIKQKVTMATKDFERMLRVAGKFYSQISNKIINSVCIRFSPKNESVTMVSSDGFKIGIAEAKAAFDKKEADDMVYVIEGEQFKEVSRIIGDEVVTFCLYEKSLFVKMLSDVAIFLTRDSSDAAYPLDAIIGTTDKVKECSVIQISVSDIINALNIFDITNECEEPYLKISYLDEGQILFETKGGTGKTRIHVKQDGKFEEIALNARLLRQAISVFGKSQDVEMVIGGTLSPVLIRKDSKTKDKVLIIPAKRDE